MSGFARLVDLSAPFGPNPGERVPVVLERLPHEAGGAHLASLVGMDPQRLEGGRAWASERITAITHAGTHMDAPFHYAPRVNGVPARTIDEMPLEWFWSEGCCVDVEAGPADALVTPEELLDWEERQGHLIVEGDIVLFHTGAGAFFGQEGYSDRGRGLSADLVRLLVARGVRVFGTDAWSIDPAYGVMRRRMEEQGADTVWAAHFVGREAEFCVMEKLCNLERLPAAGFRVACFPIKVHRGSGGWVRPVAFLDPEVAS
ncbi:MULTISPECIES: cyclase family protein [Corallococcus]|uniref:cyclase family protein n=1 Tax=Corallococcus TaxID=83461 RepID=UPI00117C221A|nr:MULTISPECIES: cyclase family protein [Corallococcus]NBD07545.1 cyclase family protein [Corallococcus silvisoli]TSC33551.1 cyclase family protein [Corallococcus sp. Z5C101001]